MRSEAVARTSRSQEVADVRSLFSGYGCTAASRSAPFAIPNLHPLAPLGFSKENLKPVHRCLPVTDNAHWTECHIGKSLWLAVPPSYHPHALGASVSSGFSDINSHSVDSHPLMSFPLTIVMPTYVKSSMSSPPSVARSQEFVASSGLLFLVSDDIPPSHFLSPTTKAKAKESTPVH
ncbi:hypothetical protein TEQG_07000 [Trichophyton equinum CBS 127.97]|uniref:Uncharacterized protein n=1 Tax=Trichophyton equinum (strain ATCC MYA-4606 / CBS 127.97) TaxID=559882 RepID=F2Q1J6_TRIEC|nr:hypothetical protein TEQG_07000 [Trichophyton equinum CBS 127.97]